MHHVAAIVEAMRNSQRRCGRTRDFKTCGEPKMQIFDQPNVAILPRNAASSWYRHRTRRTWLHSEHENIQNLTVPVVVGNAFASGCGLPPVALLPFVIKCAE